MNEALPLTVILTNAELLQGPASTPDRTAHTASSILTMARQMRALVEQLLTLARSDSGSQRPALDALGPGAKLIQTRMLPFEALFYEAGLRLRGDGTPDTVCGSRATPQTLGQVVRYFLLDNAQKYATGGEVIVRLQPQSHGRCLLTVTNEAPPLSQAELANLFKRFYRADPARSASGSFGLGLGGRQPSCRSAPRPHLGRVTTGSTITFFAPPAAIAVKGPGFTLAKYRRAVVYYNRITASAPDSLSIPAERSKEL